MDINPDTLQALLEKDLEKTETFLTSDMSAKQAAILWLRNSLIKKWESPDPVLNARCLAKFREANDRCGSVSLEPSELFNDLIIDQAKANIFDEFYDQPYQTTNFTYAEILAMGRCGPGASIGTKNTDFFHKMFSSSLTHTDPFLVSIYRDNVAGNPNWLSAELIRQDRYGTSQVKCSKLSFVPKSREISRSICTEPILNMFYQLGAGELISQSLKRYHGIVIAEQQVRNRWLARVGSVSGEYSTIDLSSASDSISINICRKLLPPKVFEVLMRLRCSHTSVQSAVKGMPDEVIELNMISSMGNGFTFALETYLFASLVKATYQIMGVKTRDQTGSPSYSVYGDDIIVRRETYARVVSVLQDCGFLVNDSKSFSEGSFRESCGGDYFNGHDVRGIYIKELSHETHVFSAVNRLARWSLRHDVQLTSLLIYLKGLVKFRPVPLHAGDAEGFKIPSAHLRARKRDCNGAIRYTAIRSKLRTVKISKQQTCLYNPFGLVIAAIGGYIRDESISFRPNKPMFKVVELVTPSWDCDPGAELDTRLERFVTLWDLILK